MANEEVIRHQMEDTRTALTEKLETLENQVVETVQGAVQTVQGATAAVSETVATIKDTVQDTVCTVKDTVEGTVAAVKGTVQDSVETMKDWMDVRVHVDRHPWLMVGGAAAIGFCVGAMLGKRPSAALPVEAVRVEPPRPEVPRATTGQRLHHHPNGGSREKRRQEPSSTMASTMASWLSEFTPEINKLKSLALGTLLGTAREMILQAVPQHMGQQLKDIVDNVTTKIGGEPIPSSDWANAPSSQGESHEERDETKMGGAVGSTHRQGQKTVGQFDRR
jgi:ElaB/YqjD/DUF883 family membrane-anchored ribosome-binding protein